MKTLNKQFDYFPDGSLLQFPPTLQDKLAQQTISCNLYVTHMGYFPKAKKHFNKRPQGCNEYILIFCADGKGTVTVNKIHTYTICANQIIIIPANTPHSYYSDELYPWSIYWAHFTGPMASAYMHYFNANKPIADINSDTSCDIIDLFRKVLFTLKNGFTIDNLTYTATAFNHIMANIFFHNQAFLKGTTDARFRMIDKTIAYMQEHLGAQLNLKQLSQVASLSTPHFSRLFRLKTNCSPIDYFNRLKIQHACQLLATTSLSIKEIGLSLGFNDPYYFSRCFSKIMHKSPSEYRPSG